MIVAGGAYFERCLMPDRHEFWGSGLRAAAAASSVAENVILYTFGNTNATKANLQMSTNDLGIGLEMTETDAVLSFHYLHPLSRVSMSGHVPPVVHQPVVQITGDVILRFGALEGDFKVAGKRVVYDPQNPMSPNLFSENGSTADELAYVLNAREARALTSQNEVLKIRDFLFNQEKSLKVLIIKDESRGAYLFESIKDPGILIPCYETGRVYNIGSGDIFSGIFAAYWADQCASAKDSAYNASYATALYCNTPVMPLSRDKIEKKAEFSPAATKSACPDGQYDVYLAAPFFDMGQRWFVEEAKQCLESQGLKIFSPLHDIGRGAAQEVAPRDIEGIKNSKVIFSIINGLDTGTIFEIGYATALNKPSIVFVENEKKEDLKMIEGSGSIVINDFTTAIYRCGWEVARA